MNRLLGRRSGRTLSIAVFSVATAMIVYLSVLAAYPRLLDGVPAWARWFGSPGSVMTIVIACVTIGSACALGWRSGFGKRSVGGPISITLVLTVISAILGFSSYVWCHDRSHPALFTALLWTGGLIKGGIDDHRLPPSAELCPADAPVALDVARVSALAAILIGISGIAIALLQSRMDRLRIRLDSSITAVVGPDGQADSMLSAVARTLEKNSRLLVITSYEEAQRLGELRRGGHRVVAVDFDSEDALASLPIWAKVNRLYLLSPDPAVNLQRLKSINKCLPASRKRRLPLTLRIDDPWQAESWRAQQMGGSDSRWVADTIGKYEVTAHRLLDTVIDDEHVSRIVVCGTTQLTLAVCANLVRRHLERKFYSEPSDWPLPSLIIVGESAEEYRKNEEFHLAQRGLELPKDWLQAITQTPSVSCLSPLLTSDDDDHVSAAVILTEAAGDPMLGTLLAAHFPLLPIYNYSPNAPELLDVPSIVGRLHTFRLTMDLPPGHSLDVWERAAMLIHNRYAAQFPSSSPAGKPWSELDEFYRGSNRRQVRNALWMVEQIAGHTWDTFGTTGGTAPTAGSADMPPLERLRQMGIDRDAALAMAKAEHHDWCRYYRRAGWRHGPERDDARRIHDGLVSWEMIEDDPEALNRALTSLAATLSALSELGYRSRPLWQKFRRTGTVIAEQRTEPWEWTSASGRPMHADAGDWAVYGPSGECWSVRDEIFRSTHQHVDGNTWRRCGVINARKARDDEVIETLEGPLTAKAGDWIVRGSRGEQWPVRPDTFKQQYEGPLPESVSDGADFVEVEA